MKDALAEALQSGDFKNLNDIVSQTVINTVNEVKRQIVPKVDPGQFNRQGNSGHSSAEEQPPQPPPASAADRQTSSYVPVWQQRMQERIQQQRQQLELQKQQEQKKHLLSRVKFKRSGNVSNVLYQVFGGIGLGVTGIITVIRLFILITGDTTLGGWVLNLLFLAFFFGMIRFGIFQRRRIKRAERYIQLCGDQRFAEIDSLANATGKTRSYVQKDLRKMLALGMFPEGHLDQSKTCFMLNDSVYSQYLDAEKSRRLREQESRTALEQENRRALEQQEKEMSEMPPLPPEEDRELNAMISEGMEFIRKLRDLNDQIPGEIISAKLFCLENLLKDIFDGVKTHPEQMHQMHKLMNYYLPTTLKLVEAYEEFDRVSSPGEEIIRAKAEIENTLDTINQAFRELLNKLFRPAVFDATTDAQVLKTMLAREGLMKEMDFATVNRQ